MNTFILPALTHFNKLPDQMRILSSTGRFHAAGCIHSEWMNRPNRLSHVG